MPFFLVFDFRHFCLQLDRVMMSHDVIVVAVGCVYCVCVYLCSVILLDTMEILRPGDS